MLSMSLQPRTLHTMAGTHIDPRGHRRLEMLNGTAPSSSACHGEADQSGGPQPLPLQFCREVTRSALCFRAGIIPVIPWQLWGWGVQEVGQRAGAGTLNIGPAYTWPMAQSKPCQHDGHSASTERSPSLRTLWHRSL